MKGHSHEAWEQLKRGHDEQVAKLLDPADAWRMANDRAVALRQMWVDQLVRLSKFALPRIVVVSDGRGDHG